MPVRFQDVSPEMVIRIHNIIQQEKPANTHYYLRFAVERQGEHLRDFFEIGVRSGVGIGDEIIVDTPTTTTEVALEAEDTLSRAAQVAAAEAEKTVAKKDDEDGPKGGKKKKK
jgi:hypothetical protein